MTRPTSFLCFGVPRSGTTLFHRVMSAHPQIICGMERFRGSQLSPEAFTWEGLLTVDPQRLTNAFRERVLGADFDRLIAIGDKIPDAYFSWPEIAARFDRLTLYVPLRNVDDIAASWRERAERVSASAEGMQFGWSAGGTTLFAYLEFYIMVKTILHHRSAHPFLFYSYSALTDPARQERIVGALLGQVGGTLTPDVREMLDRQRGETRASRDKTRSFDGPLFALKEHPFFIASNAAIATLETCDLATFADALAPIVAEFEAEGIPRFIDLIRGSAILTRPEVRTYAQSVNKIYRWIAGRTPLPAVRAYLDLFRAEEAAPSISFEGVARNALCPCGSGKRFKHCHGRLA